jgi:lipopolysaccharide biosynthesis glycosyltransferase
VSDYIFATPLDRAYVLPYSAMLASFRACNTAARAAAFVLHYDLVDDDLRYLQRVSERVGVPLTYVKIPAHPFNQFSVRKRRHVNAKELMSPIAYAKAFVDRFLPADIDRVICIDADIIIADTLCQLPSSSEAPLLAVANLPRNHHHQFNSGFMVIDLQKWRALGVANIAERFLQSYSDTLHTHDQHTLNLIFLNRWKRIGLEWNYMEDFHRFSSKSQSYTKAEIEAARSSPKIIHFAVGTDKPWRAKSQHPRADLYHKALRDVADLHQGLKLQRPGSE